MKYPQLLTKRTSELSPAKYNPRTITSDALRRLTKSLSELGNLQPITWNAKTGNIVGGHQRLKCYQALGKDEIEVWAVWLSETQEKAANLALKQYQQEHHHPRSQCNIQNLTKISSKQHQIASPCNQHNQPAHQPAHKKTYLSKPPSHKHQSNRRSSTHKNLRISEK